MNTSHLSQRPWLVTGAAGFLGSHVVEELLNEKIAVIGLDNLSGGSLENLNAFLRSPLFRTLIADIRDTETLIRVLKEWRPQVVIHLAALHYIPAAVADPELAVNINVLGTQSVLSAAMAADIEKFCFASTGDVYSPSELPHKEDDKLEPFNIYGLSKLQGEQLIDLVAREHRSKDFIIARVFNLYGPRETNPHILPEILRQLREFPEMPLRLGNLWPRRDLVPVRDAARAIIETVFRASGGLTTVNVATGSTWSVLDMLALLGDLLGRKIDVETDPAKVRAVERSHLQADVTKLRNLVGWTPDPDLTKNLAELLAVEGIKP